MAHGLQCLCDERACCPARALQLVICRSGGFTGTVTLLFQLVVSLDWYGLVRKFHKMEIVQTCTATWRWCMSMFGARFAVFVRRARVLPSPCPATRNLSFLRFHRRRHPVVSTRCFTGLVRVGVKIPHDGNRANKNGHVAVVRRHVWRTLCSVCATGARVARPVPCNS